VRAPTRTEEARSIIRPRNSPDEGRAASTPPWKRSSSKTARLRALSPGISRFPLSSQARHNSLAYWSLYCSRGRYERFERKPPLPAILLGPLSPSSADTICFPPCRKNDRVSRATHHPLKPNRECSTPPSRSLRAEAQRRSRLIAPCNPRCISFGHRGGEGGPSGVRSTLRRTVVHLSRRVCKRADKRWSWYNHVITHEKKLSSRCKVDRQTGSLWWGKARGKGEGGITVADVFERNVR